MVGFQTGRWFDYAQPPIYRDTLTLSVEGGGYLLTGLTVAVTLAGGSFWVVLAVFLHSWRVRHGQTLAIDLQYQVSLQNTSGALGTMWHAVKLLLAWRNRGVPKLLRRTLLFAIPAIVVWAGFTAAGISVSRVANKSYSSTIARIAPENCGFFTKKIWSLEGTSAYSTKLLNDTIQARTYMTSFYANTSASPQTRPIYIRSTLPFNTSTNAACHNGAFLMYTPPLDSQTMLGINAKPEDRVAVQISVTCSPIDNSGYDYEVQIGNYVIKRYDVGPITNVSNFTYEYPEIIKGLGVAYNLESVYALANDPKGSVWEPIPELSRSDADLTIFFLTQNAVSYFHAVYDPWFLANGSRTQPALPTFPDRLEYLPNNLVNTLICADQYAFCNPNTGTCTAASGIHDAHDATDAATIHNTPGFNNAQWATAARILIALSITNTDLSVFGLGPGALFANNLLSGTLSPALPDDQWRAEVLGWFTTSLTKLQAYMVEYASNNPNLGPHLYVESPFGVVTNTTFDAERYAAWQDQCNNQLVQVAGEVMNFSFLGVMIIVCVSVFLLLLSCCMEAIVDTVTKWSWITTCGCCRRRRETATARQADSAMHLLRMALGDPEGPEGNAWELGALGAPVLKHGDVLFRRPNPSAHEDRLVQYHRSAALEEQDVEEADDMENVEVDSLQEHPSGEDISMLDTQDHDGEQISLVASASPRGQLYWSP